MGKPTKKQISAELSALRELRDKIPPYSSFGDNNLKRIDAEIDVLEHNLSDRAIDAKYGDDEAEEESAGYARQWLDGDALDGSMSDNWRPLVGVKPMKLPSAPR